MLVLKFGGTSVGSAKNINKVITILEQKSVQDKLICVVSAVGGITDKLLKAGTLAQGKNEKYRNVFKEIKALHINIIYELIPNNSDSITKQL